MDKIRKLKMLDILVDSQGIWVVMNIATSASASISLAIFSPALVSFRTLIKEAATPICKVDLMNDTTTLTMEEPISSPTSTKRARDERQQSRRYEAC